MKTTTRLFLLAAFFAAAAGPLRAADKLDKEAGRIDRQAADGAGHADRLAEQFEVPVETVNGLRDDVNGWGAATIELSLARELAASDPETYPTMDEALARIAALRADTPGYGRIARELGLNLGHVVRDARHARNEMRRGMRNDLRMAPRARPGNADGPGRPGRPPRVDPPRGGPNR